MQTRPAPTPAPILATLTPPAPAPSPLATPPPWPYPHALGFFFPMPSSDVEGDLVGILAPMLTATTSSSRWTARPSRPEPAQRCRGGPLRYAAARLLSAAGHTRAVRPLIQPSAVTPTRNYKRSAWPCGPDLPYTSSYPPFQCGIFITQCASTTLRLGPSGPPMDCFLSRPGFTGPHGPMTRHGASLSLLPGHRPLHLGHAPSPCTRRDPHPADHGARP